MEKTFTTFTTRLFRFCFLLLFFTLSTVTFSYGQLTATDYRTKASGNWSDASTWQIKTTTTDGWQDAVTPPSSSNNVYIQDAHTVTLTANADCKDFHSNTTSVTAIGTFALNVNGKIRAYTGTAETSNTDGNTVGTSTTTLVAAMITTSGSGVLKFTGNSRAITVAGEWNSTALANDAEFALNAGQTGTLATGIKFNNITFSSGIISATSFISSGRSATFLIKNGARLISSRSGVSSSFVAFSSTGKCGTVTIENGGFLELTGSTPTMDCATLNNNGSVVYSGTSQALLKPTSAGVTDGAINITSYSTLILSTSGTKTPSNPITVSTLLQFNGTATIAPTAINTLTMLNGSTVDRAVSSGTSLPSTAGAVLYGTSATDLVNVTISATLTNSNEIPSAPTPGKVGILTIANGITYTFSGSRTITNLVNNGFVAFNPSTTLTLTLEGNISGAGTITGHVNASIAFSGVGSGDAGTLNLTSGSQVLNGLTINRTGTNGSVTLGTPVTLSTSNGTGSLTLSSGTLIGNGNVITITGNINGTTAGVYTATSGGKIVMAGNTIPATIASVTLANIELNDADGFTLSSPKITGYLAVLQGTATITETLTLKSTSSGTANIANSAGTISGNVTVERYIPFQRGYRTFGHPFTTGQTLAGLNSAFAITGSGIGFNSSSSSSIFRYDSSVATGTVLVGLSNSPNTTTSVVWGVGQGLYAFVRGSGTQGINFNYTGGKTASIVSYTGTINQGALQSYALGTANYTLVGNPYPCAINIKNLNSNSGLLSANTDGVYPIIYVYDPYKSGSSGADTILRGGFTGYTNDGNTDIIIPSGGAFYVKAKTSGQVLNFTESCKATSTALAIFGENTSTPSVKLGIANAQGSWDDVVVSLYSNGTSAATDIYDGEKLSNQLFDLYSVSAEGKRLCIDSRSNNLSIEQVIPLGIRTSQVGTDFKFVVLQNSLPSNAKVVLRDKLLQQKVELNKDFTNYTFAISSDSITKGNNRFQLVINGTSANIVTTPQDQAVAVSFSASPNPFRDMVTVSLDKTLTSSTKVSILNILGQQIQSKEVAAGTSNVQFSLSNESAGTYFVSVSTEKGEYTHKIVKQ